MGGKLKRVLKVNKAGKYLIGGGSALVGIGLGKRAYDSNKAKHEATIRKFSSPQQYDREINSRDTNAMLSAGKVGLGLGPAVGVGSAYHAGRAIYHGSKGLKQGMDSFNVIRDSKVLTEGFRDALNSKLPAGYGDKLIDAGKKFMEYKNANMTGSQVGKIELGLNIANKASRLPRFITNNAHLAVDNSMTGIKNLHYGKLTSAELAALDNVTLATKNIGRSATFLRNAKFLGKGAVAVGGLSGALYINGRSIKATEQGTDATNRGNIRSERLQLAQNK